MCNKTLLDKITKNVASRTLELLGSRLHKVILFGSYARGNYDTESDIDIMVLADVGRHEMYQLRKALSEISSDICIDTGKVVCILLNDKTLFEERLPILPFYRNVINEGVQVYGS